MKKLLATGLLALSSLLVTAPALAQNGPLTVNDLFGGNNSYTGDDFAAEAGLGSQALPTTIASVIRVAMGFLGIMAVVIILYGGFKWMTANGDPKKVEEAQKMLRYGITGLAIVLAAYAIASFVLASLTSAIGGNSSSSFSD